MPKFPFILPSPRSRYHEIHGEIKASLSNTSTPRRNQSIEAANADAHLNSAKALFPRKIRTKVGTARLSRIITEVATFDDSESSKIHEDARWDVFHPHSKKRYHWDMATLIMMAWVVIDVPFTAAFDIEVNIDQWEWHSTVAYFVDFFFMIDVIVNFNTGVEVDGKVSLDRLVIAKQYITSWFLIDFVSAFPLDLVLKSDSSTLQGTQLTKLLKIGRIVRMFKLIRLLRVMRVMRVVGRLEYTMSTQEALRTLWKFFVVVLVCCHLFTCLFYAIGIAYNDPVEWASGVDTHQSSNVSNYITGFYWAIMTITTIGYGDISCTGNAQRVFGMVAMIIGALLFGYGVSNVVNIVEELRQGEREFREKMDHFNIYMRENDMPLELQDSIRDFLKNVKQRQDERMSVDDEIELLSELSLALREEVAHAVYENKLNDLPFFSGEDPMIVMQLSFCLERSFLGPQEDVYTVDTPGKQMFFLLEGHVDVLMPRAGAPELSKIGELGPRTCFGENALQEPNSLRTETIRTLSFVELRLLHGDAFAVIKAQYPEFGKSLVFEKTIDKFGRLSKSTSSGQGSRRIRPSGLIGTMTPSLVGPSELPEPTIPPFLANSKLSSFAETALPPFLAKAKTPNSNLSSFFGSSGSDSFATSSKWPSLAHVQDLHRGESVKFEPSSDLDADGAALDSPVESTQSVSPVSTTNVDTRELQLHFPTHSPQSVFTAKTNMSSVAEIDVTATGSNECTSNLDAIEKVYLEQKEVRQQLSALQVDVCEMKAAIRNLTESREPPSSRTADLTADAVLSPVLAILEELRNEIRELKNERKSEPGSTQSFDSSLAPTFQRRPILPSGSQLPPISGVEAAGDIVI